MVATYEYDYYNEEGRNVRNTPQYDYNCGGYALSTFNWYCPYRNDNDHTSNLRKRKTIDEMAEHYANFMLEDFFGKLRRITDIKELEENEKAIAFRCGTDDFHYCVRGNNGVWYHKPGSSSIRVISKEIVFSKIWYSPNGTTKYNSKIILFAMKK